MKLSSRSEYGLRAMSALAGHDGLAPVPLREIAAAENIPEQYLEQIFVDLRRRGFVRSVRGAKGGYELGRPAEMIRLGDLVAALEGTLAPIDCIDNESEEVCERIPVCQARKVWLRLQESMAEALNAMTLADVVSKPDAAPIG